MTPTQKTELLEAANAHFAADMLIKGTYADNEDESFKGCSVGCFAHSALPDETPEKLGNRSDLHAIVANHFGYPVWLAHLQDTIFEGLPNGESKKWHVQLAETLATLPDDHDWQLALHRVHAAILRISYRTAGSAQEAVKTVLDLHERAGRGEDVSEDLWSAARSTTWSTSWSAAYAAAWYATWSTSWSTPWSTPWSAAYQEIRDAVLAALANKETP